MPTPKTYSAMLKHISHLQAQAEALRIKEAAGVIKRVQEAMSIYGITAEQLDPANTKQSRRGKLPRVAKPARKKPGPKPGFKRALKKPTAKKRKPSPLTGTRRPVKYADKNGNAWSGGGSMPVWLRDLVAEGKSIDDYLIKKTA